MNNFDKRLMTNIRIEIHRYKNKHRLRFHSRDGVYYYILYEIRSISKSYSDKAGIGR